MVDNVIQIIKDIASEFEYYGEVNLNNLNKIGQTAFSWSSSPNVLCLAANKRYLAQAINNDFVSAVITTPGFEKDVQDISKTIFLVKNAAECFYSLHNSGIHLLNGKPMNFVEGKIGDNCNIAPNAIVSSNVQIGNNVTIEAGCYIGSNTIIGNNVEIGPNCVIGVDGLFAKTIMHTKTQIKHFGGVKLGDKCKLHSSITVARSVNYGEFTSLMSDVHVGHQSTIGHDVSIDTKSTLSAGAIISGRATIGQNCWLGAGTIISNQCNIGDNAQVRIGAVVINDIPANQEVSGNFAISHKINLKNFLRSSR